MNSSALTVVVDPTKETSQIDDNLSVINSQIDPLDDNLPVIISTNSYNPFYLPISGSTLKFSKTHELAKRYNRLLILCLNVMTYQQTEIRKIFDENATFDELCCCSEILTIISAPINVINCNNVREGLLEIPVKFLSIFNTSLELKESELVYLMVDSVKDDVEYWINIYGSHDYFGEYLHRKRFCMFNKLYDPQINQTFIDLINNIPKNSFWSNLHNCIQNIQGTYKKRKFNTATKHLMLDNFQGNDHFYGESSSSTKVSKQNDKKGFFSKTKCDELSYHPKLMTEIVNNIKMGKKEFYHLLCNLLVHKDYCHLVLQNAFLLEAGKAIFQQFSPIFRYVMSYAWLTLLKEESVSKNMVNRSDRFVFDLETAHLLPSYYFVPSETELNPYTTLCIPKSVLNCGQGIMGPKHSENYTLGIVTPAEFQTRFNIFTTGVVDKNIFDGINWTNMVVTGGIMAAIMPLSNPLMFHPQFTCIQDFYDEYYRSSDIDVGCKFDNMIDYVDHVAHIRDTVKKNLSLIHPDVDIDVIPVKTLAIYINQSLLKEKCDNKIVPFTFEYVMQNLKKQDVKHYFYRFYMQQKIQSDQNINDKVYGDLHFNIIKLVDIENITLIVNDVFYKYDKFESNKISFYLNENDTTYIRFNENLKFKLTSKYLKHNIEIFLVSDFVRMIARFHLPCVRTYYDGKTCVMMASAISAYMTLTNIDIKYFVGKHHPIVIINKYRRRGYGVILNNYEINQMMEYIKNDESSRKMYGLGPNDPVHQIRGPLDQNHHLFKMASHVTGPQYIHSTKQIYSKKFPSCWPSLFTTSIIDDYGDVIPYQKWIIDAGYEVLN